MPHKTCWKSKRVHATNKLGAGSEFRVGWARSLPAGRGACAPPPCPRGGSGWQSVTLSAHRREVSAQLCCLRVRETLTAADTPRRAFRGSGDPMDVTRATLGWLNLKHETQSNSQPVLPSKDFKAR